VLNCLLVQAVTYPMSGACRVPLSRRVEGHDDHHYIWAPTSDESHQRIHTALVDYRLNEQSSYCCIAFNACHMHRSDFVLLILGLL
jgi:hypothetical protein